ncbi:MAG: hypothetical protein OSJ58_03510 [Dysosmobacter sp.]|nr:hypothetical protein [Dysosmobacter sp.]
MTNGGCSKSKRTAGVCCSCGDYELWTDPERPGKLREYGGPAAETP